MYHPIHVAPDGQEAAALSSSRFPLGDIVATPGALTDLEENGLSPLTLLSRHAMGDWGNVDDHDAKANEAALAHGGRILSAYEIAPGVRLWAITEADRSSTCLLRREDY